MKLLRKILPLPANSYAITVNNEAEEITRLLDILLPLIDKKDEVIVLQDITRKDEKVTAILDKYGEKIIRIEACLDGDFASFKNNLIKAAKKKYLFQIDADEYPTEYLIKNLKDYLRNKSNIDCFYVPRINIVDGITADYIQKMKWDINNKGYINFPDYQSRILKNNKKIFWKNKVHEVFYGYKKIAEMPKDYNFCLIHYKSFEKQKTQNEFYNNLELD